ncbi:MAG TPA: alpha/beta fold hydrolase [Gaiellaceae bacterium]|nr:alpha/beta fold hydrolase [Gaiellaceae bacterium]
MHVAEIGGVRTRYWVGGEGPPLLLVHGLGGAAVNFADLAPLLARRHRVLVPDLPGHGGSDRLAALAGLGDLGAHAVAVAERERMLPAALVGYSMGGVVALRLAAARPESVTALAMIAPGGIVSATRRGRIWLAVVSALRPARAVARARRPIARRPNLRLPVFGFWGAADPRRLTPEGVLGLLEAQPEHTDVPAAARALVRDDPRPDLHRVRCPTLLVWGARDRLVPLSDGFEYARRLRCPIRVLPAAGHLVVGEYADETAALLEAFLDEVAEDGWLDRVGEVDELPREVEALGDPRRERLHP